MKYLQKAIFSVLFLFMLSVSVSGQHNTTSPYSSFGIGELSNTAYGRNLALGGTGYGVRSSQYLNIKNPAALTAIDSLSFLFETGFHLKSTLTQSASKNYRFNDGNITHLIMGNRINSHLMMSLGMMPYSSIGYKTSSIVPVQNDDSTYPEYRDGTGGLAKYYYSLGAKISKNFSFGVEGAYLYGPLMEVITRSYASTTNIETINSRYSGFTVKAGLQFTTSLDDEGSELTIGGVYVPSTKLGGKMDREVFQVYSSLMDTIFIGENLDAKKLYLPQSYGGGLGLTLKGKYLIATDYEFNGWGVNEGSNYIDQHIFSAGFERKPMKSLEYFDRCSYRVGFRYDSGYIKANSEVIDDVRVSLGVGLPIQKSNSMINVTLEAGQLGSRNKGNVRESYAKLTVAFSLHDFWFVERKFD